MRDRHRDEMDADSRRGRQHAQKLDQAGAFQIRVRGRLDPSWTDWFSGLAVTVEEGARGPFTTLTGAVRDQAALRGILCKLWDLGLDLISVNRIEDAAHAGG